MLIRQIAGIVVLMAIRTTEGFKIAGGGVAIHTLIPFPFVVSTKNRKIRLVVLGKIFRIPAGIGCMTGFTVGGEITRLMVRTSSSPEIRFVTGKTIRRSIDKISSNMAARTIID